MRLQPEELLERILTEIEKAYGVTPEQVLGPKRHRRVADARHIAMYLFDRLYYNQRITETAALFNRERTSMIHAIQKIGDMRSLDRSFNRKLSNLHGKVTHAADAPQTGSQQELQADAPRVSEGEQQAQQET